MHMDVEDGQFTLEAKQQSNMKHSNSMLCYLITNLMGENAQQKCAHAFTIHNFLEEHKRKGLSKYPIQMLKDESIRNNLKSMR